MLPPVDPLSKFFSRFIRQMQLLQAVDGTAGFQFLGTGSTLNEKQVTRIVGAIHMRIRRLAAQMTNRQYVIRDPLTKPIIKNKILPDK